MFANTPKGTQSSAIAYSMIETAKENGFDPYEAWAPVLIFYSKIIEVLFECVLFRKASVGQESFFSLPLFTAAVIKPFCFIVYYEGDNVVFKTFLK